MNKFFSHVDDRYYLNIKLINKIGTRKKTLWTLCGLTHVKIRVSPS